MSPKTVIKNLTSSELFLGFVPPNGVKVAANGSVTIDGNILAELAARSNKTARQHFAAFVQAIRDKKIDAYVVPGSVHVVKEVTADTTVDANDGSPQLVVVNGSAAVTLTLPAPRVGLVVRVINRVNQNLTVNGVTGVKFVAKGNSNANSVAFTTAAENKIGAAVEFVGVSDTHYAVFTLSDHTLTVS